MEFLSTLIRDNYPNTLILLEKFSPALIALIALWITTRIQSALKSVAENKLRLDLFEKRYEVLCIVRTIAGISLSRDQEYFQKVHAEYKKFLKFKLLFPPETENKIEEFIKLCDELWASDSNDKDPSTADGREEGMRNVNIRRNIRATVKELNQLIETFVRVDWKG